MKYIPLVWASLWRKKARTLLTLLSIVVAFLLFGLLQGVNSAFSRGVDTANVDRLVVINRISLTEPLPYSYLAQIDAVPGVKNATFAVWFGGYYQEPKNFVFAFPTEIDRYLATVKELIVDPADVEAFKQSRTAAIVGRAAMQKFGWKIGDRVPLHSTIWAHKDTGSLDWAFDIVGTYSVPEDPNNEQSLMFHYDYFDEARSFGTGTVGWYIVQVDDPTRSAAVAAAIDARFANSPNETKTQTEKEFGQSFLKQFGDINYIVTMILFAVFFTLLLLTGVTMMQSVRERTAELAVLKTLGFSDTKVLILVVGESLLLCMFAALLGLGLSAAMFPQLKQFVGEASLPANVVALGIGAAVLLSLAIALLPGIRAQRLEIVDALAGR